MVLMSFQKDSGNQPSPANLVAYLIFACFDLVSVNLMTHTPVARRSLNENPPGFTRRSNSAII
jgi:hypothetical protein